MKSVEEIYEEVNRKIEDDKDYLNAIRRKARVKKAILFLVLFLIFSIIIY